MPAPAGICERVAVVLSMPLRVRAHEADVFTAPTSAVHSSLALVLNMLFIALSRFALRACVHWPRRDL